MIIKCENTSVRCKRFSETKAKDRYSALGLPLADKVDVVVDGLGAANMLPLTNVGALVVVGGNENSNLDLLRNNFTKVPIFSKSLNNHEF